MEDNYERKKIKTIAVALLMSGAVSLYGQQGSGRKNQGAVWRLYDPSTVTAVQGEIVSVQKNDSRWGQEAGQKGIHIDIKTSSKSITVYLGPERYIAPKMTLSKGDKVSVIGSRVVYENKQVMIAKSIKKNAVEITLRDDGCMPLWAKQRGVRERNK